MSNLNKINTDIITSNHIYEYTLYYIVCGCSKNAVKTYMESHCLRPNYY